MARKVNPLSQSFGFRGLVSGLWLSFAFGYASQGTAAGSGSDTQLLTYRIVNQFPHDIRHFTQGLEIDAGILWESTGGYGRSGVYKKTLRAGAVEATSAVDLPPAVFGEGLTAAMGRIFVLTWREGLAFSFDRQLRDTKLFRLRREGWGLTHMPTLAGERLVSSDGSSRLYFLRADTWQETGSLDVSDQGEPVRRLNELEYARGELYANVWQSSRVAVIQPGTGKVRAWIDFSRLEAMLNKPSTWDAGEHVLNGIAYDAESGHFFVTGKCWPSLFEVDVMP